MGEDTIEVFVCLDCNKRIRICSELVNELRRHDLDVICDDCGKTFKRKNKS